uniref:Uncharacterized protein n=1 Tax=Anguilla anguilla TaxID=7936 RepID=A0A0E9RYW8_ANGAN
MLTQYNEYCHFPCESRASSDIFGHGNWTY